jgi:hypothetical protein
MTNIENRSRAPFSPLNWHWGAELRLHPLVWVFALSVFAGSWVFLPGGGFDWHNDIGPSTRQWWPAPYESGVNGLPLAPWAALLLSPLGGLPNHAATAITNAITVFVVALVVKRFGGRDWLALPILLTPSGFWLFYNGQTEWLMLFGLLFFNGFDALLLILKPQVAAGAIVSRIRRADQRWWIYLTPLVAMILLSFLVWHGWFLKIFSFAPILIKGDWNSSVWPWGMVVGIGLLWQAWKTGDDRWGVAASPLLSPYVNLPSYLGLLIVLAARWPRWFLLIWGLVWIGAIVSLIVNR